MQGGREPLDDTRAALEFAGCALKLFEFGYAPRDVSGGFHFSAAPSTLAKLFHSDLDFYLQLILAGRSDRIWVYLQEKPTHSGRVWIFFRE